MGSGSSTSRCSAIALYRSWFAVTSFVFLRKRRSSDRNPAAIFSGGWPFSTSSVGGSTRAIAERYGLTRERCGQIISDWRIRAVALGYIQDVTPEGTDLARLADSHAVAPIGRRPAVSFIRRCVSVLQSWGSRVTPPTEHRRNDTMSQTPFAISATPRLPSILR